MVAGPTFATTLDLAFAITADEAARTELERLLAHLLGGGQEDAAIATRTRWSTCCRSSKTTGASPRSSTHSLEWRGPEVLDADGRVKERGFVSPRSKFSHASSVKCDDVNGNRICKKEIDPNGALAIVPAGGS